MKTLHKKWVVSLGVVLMLIGMVVYILTLDESELLQLPGDNAATQAAPAE